MSLGFFLWGQREGKAQPVVVCYTFVMPVDQGVLRILREAMPRLREEFAVETLAVFGSAARGECRDGSDVDVLVTFREGATVTLLTLAAVTSFLEESLGCRVDVIEDHPRLLPAFRRGIERDLLRVA